MGKILIWICMACSLCIFGLEKSSSSWQFRLFREAVLPKEVEVGPGPAEEDKPQKTKRTFYSARMMKLSGVKRQIVRRGTRHK